MDLSKAIQDLYAEKEKLERVIASLEELQRAAEGGQVTLRGSKRRGRKSMGDGERAEVSERMKKSLFLICILGILITLAPIKAPTILSFIKVFFCKSSFELNILIPLEEALTWPILNKPSESSTLLIIA